MRFFYTFLLFCLSLASLSAQSVRIEHLSTRQGLSHGTITSLMQDTNGYLWIGTNSGLNRYDGYDFKVYSQTYGDSTTLPNNVVRVTFQDRNGNFWVGVDGNGLIRFDPATGNCTSYRHNPDNPDSPSHNDVYAISQDEEGQLWIGTYGGGLDRFNPGTGRWQHYKHNPAEPNSLSDNYVNTIFRDSQGALWLGTDGGGLDRLDPVTGRITRHTPRLPAGKRLTSAPVWGICEDNAGYLWLGTDGDGLLRYDRQKETFRQYIHNPQDYNSLGHNHLTALLKDHSGAIWAGTWGGGLTRLEPATGQFTRYTSNPTAQGHLSSNTIYCLYQDRSGFIWAGTNGHGLNKIDVSQPAFRSWRHNPFQPDGLSDNAPRAFLEDRNGSVWVGTNGSGLDYFDPVTGKAIHHRPVPGNVHSLSGLAVIALCEDRGGNVWAGTYDGGLNKLDRKTGRFTRYTHNPANPKTLADNRVLTLLPDPDGTLWVGTYESGISILNPKTGNFSHLRHNPRDPNSLSSDAIRHLYRDSKGNIWIGTANGLNQYDPQQQRFYRYGHQSGNNNSLSSNKIRSIYEDKQGVFWIGTAEGGLNRLHPASGKITRYTGKDGLPDDGVYGVLGDDAGTIWVSTNRGLACFIPSRNKFLTYHEADGLQGGEFGIGAFHKGRSGKLYFGGYKGFSAFHPAEVNRMHKETRVLLTTFRAGGESRPDLLTKSAVNLNHKENSLTFEFAAINFDRPEKTLYAYQLEGVDVKWMCSGNRRYVNYANLKGGTYVFKVKAKTQNGEWPAGFTSLTIHIQPPWWQAVWFKAIVAFSVVSLGFVMYKLRVDQMLQQNRQLEALIERRTEELRIRGQQLEKALAVARQQKQEADHQRERAEEANRMKTELTNITVHDLKNPLGALLIYADIIRDSAGEPGKVVQLARTVKEATRDMLHLITNLLHRARLESQSVMVKKELTDFSLLVRMVVARNRIRAEHKCQRLLLHTEPGCHAPLDAELVTEVVENLVSNAIKFTPKERSIWISVGRTGDKLTLCVTDEGLGIKPEDFPKLFMPFQRLSASPTGNESSTGLGLSLVKRIVELHGGQIMAESEGDLKGSTFTVTLPAGAPEAFSEEDYDRERAINLSTSVLVHT